MIVDEYLDYLHESSVKKKVATAAVATAIAAIAITFKAYKKLMDGADKACKKSPDKDVCVATFRHQAYKKRIASLKKSMSKCTKTNDSAKCKKYIKKIITSLRRRIK
jgi:hypothetical protein